VKFKNIKEFIMDLVKPGIGLLFWMLLSFGIVLFILRKYAWGPILNALRDREDSIDEALRSAEKAREEMSKLKADNEKILAGAKKEREKIIGEARQIREKMIGDAKKEATSEARKQIDQAKREIQSQKVAAIEEIKKQIADISVEIAGKILQENISVDEKQQKLIEKDLDRIKFN